MLYAAGEALTALGALLSGVGAIVMGWATYKVVKAKATRKAHDMLSQCERQLAEAWAQAERHARDRHLEVMGRYEPEPDRGRDPDRPVDGHDDRLHGPDGLPPGG